MLQASSFFSFLQKAGFNVFACVPCSFLAPLIDEAMHDPRFIMAHNEGDAAALCAGAHLCGQLPLLICQNSGLSNALSPLISLHHPFSIPLIAMVGYRGEPKISDELHHQLMGSIHHDLLKSIGIASPILSTKESQASKQIEEAIKGLKDAKSTFFAVNKDTFYQQSSYPKIGEHAPYLTQLIPRSLKDQLPPRIMAMAALKELGRPTDAYIATLGLTSRELFNLGDSEANFYMVGSMGCVGPFALGIGLFAKDKFVTILDGDGSLLMRLSALPLLARYGKKNLFHVLLDNGCHASTGGQRTASELIDFVLIAHAVGFARAIYTHSIAELTAAYRHWQKDPALTFVYLRVSDNQTKLKRPCLSPQENARRFSQFLFKGNQDVAI